MKSKMKIKVKYLLGTAVILIIIIIIATNISTEIVENAENDNQTIIEPEEEISDEINYETNIVLYYPDKQSGVITKENRIIDARELIDNPYAYTLNLLIQGPKNENLINTIPDGTRVNSATLKKGTLYIDLSTEFLNSNGMDSINSIVNTMSEFNEINTIKFTIEGQKKDGLKEEYLRTN